MDFGIRIRWTTLYRYIYILCVHAFTTYLHVRTYHCINIGVQPPQQLLLVTRSGSLLYGSEVIHSYAAVSPVIVNTISRLMYWYNSTLNSVMVQSLDGNKITVSMRVL